jgi:hypothetical protein
MIQEIFLKFRFRVGCFIFAKYEHQICIFKIYFLDRCKQEAKLFEYLSLVLLMLHES